MDGSTSYKAIVLNQKNQEKKREGLGLYSLVIKNLLRQINRRITAEAGPRQYIHEICIAMHLIALLPSGSQMAAYKTEAGFVQTKSKGHGTLHA